MTCDYCSNAAVILLGKHRLCVEHQAKAAELTNGEVVIRNATEEAPRP